MEKRNAGRHAIDILPKELFPILPNLPITKIDSKESVEKPKFIFGKEKFQLLHLDSATQKKMIFDLAKIDDTQRGVKWPSTCNICFRLIGTKRHSAHCIKRTGKDWTDNCDYICRPCK